MASEPPGTPGPKGGAPDRLLRLFSDVRPGESMTVLLMSANIFLILVGYYVLKTVREPLILITGGAEIPGLGGAEVKSFSAAGQALLLMGFIPLYSWFASRVGRVRLIVGFNIFFILCIEVFYLAGRTAVPYTGIAFFIWVGIFNNSVVAQFWSFANDIYSRPAGERLFPIIVVGMTAGTPIGSKIAATLFGRGVDPYTMMQLGVIALVISLLLYLVVHRREEHRPQLVSRPVGTAPAPVDEPPSGRGGFSLIFRSRYLLLIALTLVLANRVNTTGEYILDRLILAEAEAHGLVDAERSAFIGEFRGNFYFWVNIAAVLIQAFVVSRLVRSLGIAGVVFALPVVAFGVYGLVAAGAGFVVTRWAKTAENSTDYSIMNTAKAMLWLPTTQEEKYKAKQATDTFFVRVGDVMSAVLVFVGTSWLLLSTAGFAAFNLALVAVWLVVAAVLVRENRRLTAVSEARGEADAA